MKTSRVASLGKGQLIKTLSKKVVFAFYFKIYWFFITTQRTKKLYQHIIHLYSEFQRDWLRSVRATAIQSWKKSPKNEQKKTGFPDLRDNHIWLDYSFW